MINNILLYLFVSFYMLLILAISVVFRKTEFDEKRINMIDNQLSNLKLLESLTLEEKEEFFKILKEIEKAKKRQVIKEKVEEKESYKYKCGTLINGNVVNLKNDYGDIKCALSQKGIYTIHHINDAYGLVMYGSSLVNTMPLIKLLNNPEFIRKDEIIATRLMLEKIFIRLKYLTEPDREDWDDKELKIKPNKGDTNA